MENESSISKGKEIGEPYRGGETTYVQEDMVVEANIGISITFRGKDIFLWFMRIEKCTGDNEDFYPSWLDNV